MEKKLQQYIIKGKIIGLGESSHGSATEFKWRSNFILESIKNNLDQKFVIYLEAYKDSIQDLFNIIQSNNILSKETVIECLNRNYKIWQTQEMCNFIFDLYELISNKGADIQMYGVDFDNTESKQSMNKSEMINIRSETIYRNIQSEYKKDAIHFFLSHNLNINKQNDEFKEVGSFLVDEFENRYISIAQHVSGGLIRARNSEGVYREVNFKYEEKLNSVTSLTNHFFNTKDSSQSVIVFSREIIKHKIDNMEQIGFFYPMMESWLMNITENSFDAIVLHKNSIANHELSM
jgi:hypothetical protein